MSPFTRFWFVSHVGLNRSMSRPNSRPNTLSQIWYTKVKDHSSNCGPSRNLSCCHLFSSRVLLQTTTGPNTPGHWFRNLHAKLLSSEKSVEMCTTWVHASMCLCWRELSNQKNRQKNPETFSDTILMSHFQNLWAFWCIHDGKPWEFVCFIKPKFMGVLLHSRWQTLGICLFY